MARQVGGVRIETKKKKTLDREEKEREEEKERVLDVGRDIFLWGRFQAAEGFATFNLLQMQETKTLYSCVDCLLS